MRKSITRIMTLIFALTFTTIPVLASEAINPPETTTISSTQSFNTEISPQIVHSYTKTVKKTYAAYPVPDSIYYTEYNMSAWFSGTLYLNSIYRLNNVWHATYIGTLVGVI